jgi:FkbM family methyltransferase
MREPLRRVARRYPRVRQIAITLLNAGVALKQREPIERRISHLTTARGQVRLQFLARWLCVRDAIKGSARPIRFDLRYQGLTVPWWVAHTSDLWVLWEVLAEDEYAVDIEPPKVVLDLGSHIGVSLLYFRRTYPQARIIGVEPDPETFRLLERNTACLGIEVHRLAVAAHDADVPFYRASQPWASSLAGSGESITVKARSLSTLIDELGVQQVDLLKLDIEGMEGEVLRASRDRLLDIATVVGELHGTDPAARKAFFGLFEGFDLDVTETSHGHVTFAARC